MYDPDEKHNNTPEVKVEIMDSSSRPDHFSATTRTSKSGSTGPPTRVTRGAGGLKRFFRCIPGVPSIVALYSYLLDDDAPTRHKLAILGSFLYFIWPGDLISDLFLGPGYVDDLAVFWGLLQFIGSDNLQPYRDAAKKWLRGEIDDPGKLEKRGGAEG